MTTIPIVCPKCRIAAAVPESFAGRTVRCKHCKTRTFVPIPDEPADNRQAKPGAKPTKVPRRPIVYACPHCDAPITAPASVAGRDLACPACRKRTIVPDRQRSGRGWRYVVAAVAGTLTLATISRLGAGRSGVFEPMLRDLAAWLSGGVTFSMWVVLPIAAFVTYRIVCVANPRAIRPRRKHVTLLVAAGIFGLLVGSVLILIREGMPLRIMHIAEDAHPPAASPTPAPPTGLPPAPSRPAPRPRPAEPENPPKRRVAEAVETEGARPVVKVEPQPSPEDLAKKERRDRIDVLAKELAIGTTGAKIAAARELGKLGPDAAEPLIRAASDDSTGEVRPVALESLEKAAPDLYRPVVALMVDPDWQKKSQSLIVLQELGPKAGATASLLLNLYSLTRLQERVKNSKLFDIKSQFIIDVINTLAVVAPEREDVHEAILIGIADSGSPDWLRIETMATLERLISKNPEIDHTKVVNSLIQAAQDRDVDYKHSRRITAIHLLGSLGRDAKDARGLLRRLKLDKASEVREAASLAMERIGEP